MVECTKVVPQAWTLPATGQPLVKPKQAVEDNMNAYMAYFDTLGFEWIFNITEYEKKKFWAVLKGDDKVDFPIPRYAILRAQANPQRFPEIWTFQSELDLEDILCYTKDMPQAMADLIRKNGNKVFTTPKEKTVIL